jgi:hypothetical protein
MSEWEKRKETTNNSARGENIWANKNNLPALASVASS